MNGTLCQSIYSSVTTRAVYTVAEVKTHLFGVWDAALCDALVRSAV